ncbi:germ cell-less 2, spermatogenesis associated [Phyllostomus discolor]|uniref:Germ cell-less 2, spermatogenesis associated n=1 Tax=Phyllostomus discolor TaxID=89673 RepID=A0A6J2MGT3_9CHIR|nr:germ cell-less protein-like 1 [Phyllostomus discolor]KAF6090498.1 germ cell-less 2, spermatogenesis associated [Phyllostomus discolor]
MGSVGSRILTWRESALADPHQSEAQAGPSYVTGHRKRKRSRPSTGPESEDSPRSLDLDQELRHAVTPNHGKKVKIASECAYQTLFLSGETSDIKIRALGKVWRLHKKFLCQSGYFAMRFGGSWEGSHDDIIELQINDQNIDAESLHFVLGSLYRDQYVIREPLQVLGVLATAHLLQVEDLIRQCEQTMEDTIDAKTVCGYYAAAETYGLDSVKTGCFEWLLHNLMTHPSVELYKGLRIDLMNLLVSSSNLLVMQKEIDVYTTLKEWMFLRLNPAWKGSIRELVVHANNWFSRHRECSGCIAFLETKRGRAFQSVFKNLRFQHIICDLASTRVIERDAVIPSEWLSHVYKQQWFALLRAQQCREIGPRYINGQELEEYSMRCGKMIVRDGKYSWKWSGFNFGFPLHVIFTSHYVLFKQNTLPQPCDAPDCSRSLRNVAFRLTLVHFNSSGKISFHKTTGYKILTFQKDEEQVVMKLDSRALRFPLYIFCNFLFISLENP